MAILVAVYCVCIGRSTYDGNRDGVISIHYRSVLRVAILLCRGYCHGYIVLLVTV